MKKRPNSRSTVHCVALGKQIVNCIKFVEATSDSKVGRILVKCVWDILNEKSQNSCDTPNLFRKPIQARDNGCHGSITSRRHPFQKFCRLCFAIHNPLVQRAHILYSRMRIWTFFAPLLLQLSANKWLAIFRNTLAMSWCTVCTKFHKNIKNRKGYSKLRKKALYKSNLSGSYRRGVAEAGRTKMHSQWQWQHPKNYNNTVATTAHFCCTQTNSKMNIVFVTSLTNRPNPSTSKGQ